MEWQHMCLLRRVDMMNNQKIDHFNLSEGNFTELKALDPNKGTGSKRKVCKTPYSMGLTKIKTPIEKAQENPKSLRLAINAKCYDCMGCGFDGHPANEIRLCEISDCPLWLVRPYQNKKAKS